MNPQDEIYQREGLRNLLSGTTTTSSVYILNRTETSSPIGGVIHSWSTATSTLCAIQPIPAFRRIQEGLLVAQGGESVVTTHRGFMTANESVNPTDRIETSSGVIYDVKNVRSMDSHIEFDMMRVENN